MKAFKKWLWQNDCILCHDATNRDIALCKVCEKALPWNNRCCKRCALPIEQTEQAPYCGQCLTHPPPFSSTIALFKYQHPIDQFITQLKFSKKLIYAKLLAKLFGEYINQHQIAKPDCIIPVPLHPRRLRERGFNQALEIARPLAKLLKITLNFTSYQRQRHTKAQSTLSAKKRLNNLKNAFIASKPVHAKHIAIIDDVMTTGQTVTELSKIISQTCEAKIDIWCCARSSLQV